MNALMTENDCLKEELELAQRTNFALADEINSLRKQLNDSLKHNHALGEELARRTCDFNEQLITLHLQHHPMLTAEEIAEDLELELNDTIKTLIELSQKDKVAKIHGLMGLITWMAL